MSPDRSPTPAVEGCQLCGGRGWITEMRQVCCRRPLFDGSCCGMGEPEEAQVQCELCEEPMDDATRYALGAM
jgi:hypothetical protein